MNPVLAQALADLVDADLSRRLSWLAPEGPPAKKPTPYTSRYEIGQWIPVRWGGGRGAVVQHRRCLHLTLASEDARWARAAVDLWRAVAYEIPGG